MNKLILIAGITLLSSVSRAQDVTNTSFGKGLYNVVAKDSSFSMKFGLRIQSLFIGENIIHEDDGIGAGTSRFLMRRARLKFGGFAFSPKLKYKIELGLSNKDLGKVDGTNNMAPKMILDAVIKWNFFQNFELWAGQTKLPGNRERVISSANLLFVDRSMLNSNFNIDRDIGVQLHHHFTLGENFVVREKFSISQGEGRNIVQDNIGGLQYTGRIELLPFGKFASKGDYTGADLKREKTPKLAICATYDYNDRAAKTKSNQGSYMLDSSGENADGFFHSNVSTIFADMMFKYNGVSIMAEYALRDADIVNHYSSDSTSTATIAAGSGLNFSLAYTFKNNWEIGTRYTQFDPAEVTGGNSKTQYTFGVSKFIVGHKLKVQSDVSYLTTEDSANSELMYRLQFELHF